MKEFYNLFFKDTETYVKVICIFLHIGVAIAGLSLLMILFPVLNFSGRENIVGVGNVVGLKFLAEHKEYTGKTVIHYPDTWRADISINGIKDDLVVRRHHYDTLQLGKEYKIIYKSGRFNDDIKVEGILEEIK